MEKAKKITWRIFVVLSLIFVALTVYKLVMTVAYPNKIPTFFGYSGSFVVSGSMEPTISTGDMVICKAQDSYEINDVIVYYDEQDGVFVMHRIIGNSADGFFTKGDFNPDHDPVPVPTQNVQGKIVLAIPNMKTVRDIMIGALLVLLFDYGIKPIVAMCKAQSKKGGEETDEEKI